VNTSPGGWIIAAVAIVFIVDLLAPLGYAVPMLYVLPILLTGVSTGPKEHHSGNRRCPAAYVDWRATLSRRSDGGGPD